MKRIYHHHNRWEEVKYNMYGDSKNKEIDTQRVINYFRQLSKVEKYMQRVVEEFKYSCEHNFTNPNMNHIAWLGQASVALCLQIPEDITRNAWSYLTEKEQNNADNIAIKKIEEWKKCQKNI